MLSQLSSHFRDLLLTKSLLREKMARRDVFHEVRPKILESYGNLYQRKFRSLFDAVERIGDRDLSRFLARLEEIDLNVKSTGAAPQALFEAFVWEYCRRRK